MTEINFLVDLILNHKLPLATKKVIAERLKLVSEQQAPVQKPMNYMGYIPPPQALAGPQQAPSTIANLAKHGLPVPEVAPQDSTMTQATPPPVPVSIVAQTPAAAAALASRAEAIHASLERKIDKTTGRPRKF